MSQNFLGPGPQQQEFNALQASSSAQQDGLAIVSNGNTHAAITSGQFVYVKNHSSLGEGLYRATAAISANGALSTSNLTADSAGGLNALKADVDTLSSNLGITNITIDVSTYTYSTQEGATALFTALPSPFKGVCYASFASGIKAIVTANKTNNNYGSMTYTVDYDVEPYYYGKRNTSIVFDRIALNSKFSNLFQSYEPLTFPFTPTSNGLGIITYEAITYATDPITLTVSGGGRSAYSRLIPSTRYDKETLVIPFVAGTTYTATISDTTKGALATYATAFLPIG